MNWTKQFDGYCERVDFTFWSEPVNALTNIAFVVAAVLMWRLTRDVPRGRVMSALLFLIGLGSFAFHTTATAWGALADTAPIVYFVLYYIFAANRDFFGLGRALSVFIALAFLPVAALGAQIFGALGLGSSSAYAPVPILIFLYAILLVRKSPKTAEGLAQGAAYLCLSLIFRWVDEPICAVMPMGTHFAWHLINAIMLAHMIGVYRAHMLEGGAAPR